MVSFKLVLVPRQTRKPTSLATVATDTARTLASIVSIFVAILAHQRLAAVSLEMAFVATSATALRRLWAIGNNVAILLAVTACRRLWAVGSIMSETC
jgi:hypothetical protein